MPAFYVHSLEVEREADGRVMVVAGRGKVPADMYVRVNWNAQLAGLAQNLWTYLAIFIAAPLLSSYLEKGWADLLLTKAVPRWQVLLGRMAGSAFVFAVVLFFMHVITALYFGWRTGISPVPFLKAIGIVWFAFVCLVSLMALVGVSQPSVALLVMVGFLQIFLSRGLLAGRKEMVEFFKVKWLEPVLDFMHAVLPRTKELGDIAADLLNRQPVESWSPLWWSAGLVMIYTMLACYLLHRKAI
jgi:hypothetical protein